MGGGGRVIGVRSEECSFVLGTDSLQSLQQRFLRGGGGGEGQISYNFYLFLLFSLSHA